MERDYNAYAKDIAILNVFFDTPTGQNFTLEMTT